MWRRPVSRMRTRTLACPPPLTLGPTTALLSLIGPRPARWGGGVESGLGDRSAQEFRERDGVAGMAARPSGHSPNTPMTGQASFV
jgi:hypothetical protein